MIEPPPHPSPAEPGEGAIETRDRVLLERVLRRDGAWAGYGLGDLDDAPFRRARWFLSDPDGTACALLYDWGDPTDLPCDPSALASPRESVVVIPYGERAALGPLLGSIPLPARFDAHVRVEHADALRAVIDASSFAALVPHRRLALASAELRRPAPVAGLEVRPLGATDIPAALSLYAASYPGTWFDPLRVLEGRYLGAWSGPDLVAIAGTHVLSRVRRVAAIGDVVTALAWRGRGVAAWLTSALVLDLRLDVDLLVLNVEATNAPGLRAYRRIGFGAKPGHDLAHLEGHGLARR